jgi:hypothetical protein
MNISTERYAEIREAHRIHIRATAIMVFVIYWLMVFTYPNFFIFRPNEETEVLRQVALWLCLIGWLLAAIATPILLFAASGGNKLSLKFIPVTAMWWPASLIFSQITVVYLTGESYINYLVDYPIFLITDLAIPVLVIWKWSQLKESVALVSNN